jgi:hypothetical protein
VNAYTCEEIVTVGEPIFGKVYPEPKAAVTGVVGSVAPEVVVSSIDPSAKMIGC